MKENLRSEKMRTQPVGGLLFKMALPAILSMLVQALYNVVDTVFVSHYDARGLTALSLAYPLQMLIVAFAVGIGVGANARIAKELGERRKDEASLTAKNAVMMSLICFAVFAVVGAFAARPFIKLFTADEVVADMGGIYLMIVMCGSIGAFVEICCSKILQATGSMMIPMFSQLIGAVVNIVLDPILIFVCDMGVTGAALATIIGQITAMCFVLSVFIFKKHDVSLSPKGFRPSLKKVGNICMVGLPTMAMNAVTSITTTAMNAVLMGYEYAVETLGIYFKLQSFVFMPVFGLMQGAMPILSYNYGSKDKSRYLKGTKYTVLSALAIMAAGMILFEAGAPLLMAIFNAGGEFARVGSYALRIIAISFLFAALGITATTVLQSLQRGVTSFLMSIMRQIVILLPAAWLLSKLFGLAGVWFCYPIAEIIVAAIFTPVAVAKIHKSFKSAPAVHDTIAAEPPLISDIEAEIAAALQKDEDGAQAASESTGAEDTAE